MFEHRAPVLVSPDTSTSPERQGTKTIVTPTKRLVCAHQHVRHVAERTQRSVDVEQADDVGRRAGRPHIAAV